ncbi:MAG TPA: F0F1 ATP synthase subunit delta [Verrucomicrobiae bacterium]|jgi:F-type H+-transporting ATPase subunit delta|nr:F0F1 ATP synthase subunit delta [Verrucomicrobiae bacterium]
MKISKQARRDARELFRTCMVHDALDENRARQALAAVVRTKPRGFIAILSHFQRLIRLEVARRTATIESATTLPQQEQGQIQSDLTRQYGPGLAFTFTQNPALIGGVRIQVGGDVYNGTVQGRLAALQQSA